MFVICQFYCFFLFRDMDCWCVEFSRQFESGWDWKVQERHRWNSPADVYSSEEIARLRNKVTGIVSLICLYSYLKTLAWAEAPNCKLANWKSGQFCITGYFKSDWGLTRFFPSFSVPRNSCTFVADEHRPIHHYDDCVHTGWAKKVNPKCSAHNFVKYWPILKILSPLQSPENLQCVGY